MVIPFLFGAIGLGILGIALAIGLIGSMVIMTAGVVKCMLWLNELGKSWTTWADKQARRFQDFCMDRRSTLRPRSSGARAWSHYFLLR